MAWAYTSDISTFITKETFMDHVDIKDSGCWEWNKSRNTRRGGYGQKNINRKVYSSHRLSYLLFKGDIPDGMLVCHKCDNPPCCNPEHLFLGTYKDNAIDAWEKGRMPLPSNSPKGSDVWSSKLSEHDVIAISERLELGESYSSIKKEYKVSRQTLHKIKNKVTWKHLWEFDA